MVRLTIVVDRKLNRAYIPKELMQELGGKKWGCLSNARAAIVFKDDSDLKEILQSLDIIRADVEHRIQIKENSEEEE